MTTDEGQQSPPGRIPLTTAALEEDPVVLGRVARLVAEAQTRDSDCNERVTHYLRTNGYLIHLMRTMEELGCPTPRSMFHCIPCKQLGLDNGYAMWHPKHGMLICEDISAMALTEMETTIMHEMIHAYDQCRIRASNLSGECDFTYEVGRKSYDWSIRAHREACVRRRAILSLQAGKRCRGYAIAAVEKAWPLCYPDLEPFDHIPE